MMNVKNELLCKMKRALGFPVSAAPAESFLAYRNLFLSRGRPDGDWENLVRSGYATRLGEEYVGRVAYALSREGIGLLEEILCCRIRLLAALQN